MGQIVPQAEPIPQKWVYFGTICVIGPVCGTGSVSESYIYVSMNGDS